MDLERPSGPCENVNRPHIMCPFEFGLKSCWKRLNGTGSREENIRSCLDCVTGVVNFCRDGLIWKRLIAKKLPNVFGFCDDCGDYVSKCELQRCWDISIGQTIIENIGGSTTLREDEVKRLQALAPTQVTRAPQKLMRAPAPRGKWVFVPNY